MELILNASPRAIAAGDLVQAPRWASLRLVTHVAVDSHVSPMPTFTLTCAGFARKARIRGGRVTILRGWRPVCECGADVPVPESGEIPPCPACGRTT